MTSICREHQIRSHSSYVLQFPNHSFDQCVLSLITHRCLLVQVRTLQLSQRRHHCFCIPQLNNVQAFVHILVCRFHCQTSAFSFVHTLKQESQVHRRNAWIECLSSLLITTIFAICIQNFSSVAGLVQMRGSSTRDTTRVSSTHVQIDNVPALHVGSQRVP